MLGLYTLEAAAQPGMKRDVLVGLQEQRIQKLLAELSVPRPRLTGLIRGEGPQVDEARRGSEPLDVVRRGILERHPVVESRQRDIELEERRILEHSERPLVGIRDERDRFVFEDTRPLRV